MSDNHVAIVQRGRAGSAARIGDGVRSRAAARSPVTRNRKMTRS
nr:DUF2213 domain-containing protein [Sinorhizobium meliloti]